jgi:Leucine-rich repeat (LRR) protein
MLTLQMLTEAQKKSVTVTEVLFLSSNAIDSVSKKVLTTLSSLRVLSLKQNALVSFEIDTADAPQLEQLILTSNHIESAAVRHEKLRKLMLSFNSLSVLSGQQARDLPMLELVRLAQNEIKELDAEAWFTLPRLAWVALAGNPWLGISDADMYAVTPPHVRLADLELEEKVGCCKHGSDHAGAGCWCRVGRPLTPCCPPCAAGRRHQWQGISQRLRRSTCCCEAGQRHLL